jgi:hypothetical protein
MGFQEVGGIRMLLKDNVAGVEADNCIGMGDTVVEQLCLDLRVEAREPSATSRVLSTANA